MAPHRLDVATAAVAMPDMASIGVSPVGGGAVQRRRVRGADLSVVVAAAVTAIMMVVVTLIEIYLTSSCLELLVSTFAT